MDFPARCTSPKCGRNIYGPVTFCPFCGTRFVLSDEEPIRQSGKAFEPQDVEPPPKPVPPQQPVKGSSVTEPLPIRPQESQPAQLTVPVTAKPPVTEQEASIPTVRVVQEEERAQKETEDSGKGLPKSRPTETGPIVSTILKEEIDRKKKTPLALIAGAVGGVVLIGLVMIIFRSPGKSPDPMPPPPSVLPPASIPTPKPTQTPGPDKQPPEPKPVRPPAALAAEVRIVTNPPGAVVSVDGEKWGISPAHVKNLPPGQHVFDISKSGFRDEHVNVTLSKGDKKDLQVSLASLPKEPPPPKPPPAPSRDEVAERDLAEAIRNYEQGKLDVSIVQFEAILRRDSENKKAKEYLSLAQEQKQKAYDIIRKKFEETPYTGGKKR